MAIKCHFSESWPPFQGQSQCCLFHEAFLDCPIHFLCLPVISFKLKPFTWVAWGSFGPEIPWALTGPWLSRWAQLSKAWGCSPSTWRGRWTTFPKALQDWCLGSTRQSPSLSQCLDPQGAQHTLGWIHNLIRKANDRRRHIIWLYLLGWPTSLFEYVYNILWKGPNTNFLANPIYEFPLAWWKSSGTR